MYFHKRLIPLDLCIKWGLIPEQRHGELQEQGGRTGMDTGAAGGGRMETLYRWVFGSPVAPASGQSRAGAEE